MAAVKWTPGTWSGLPKFDCARCPFDTLVEAEMVAHSEQHDAAEAPVRRLSSLVGPDGQNLIIEEKPADAGAEE